jgi:hypothetical protein
MNWKMATEREWDQEMGYERHCQEQRPQSSTQPPNSAVPAVSAEANRKALVGLIVNQWKMANPAMNDHSNWNLHLAQNWTDLN